MFYLASQSPRRKDLLATLNIPFNVLAPDQHTDMEALEAGRPNEAPLTYVKRVTRAKLHQAITHIQPCDSLLCADTAVALGKTILGKPFNAANNTHVLSQLQGKQHRVLTAVALYHNHQIYETVCVSYVKFGAMNPAEINHYALCGEGWDKAGGYAIQGKAAAFIESIRGNYTGIVGLPIWHTRVLLQQAGLIPG
jgi:septum formation protein